MAFILKSIKLIPGLVRFTRQRSLIGRRNVIFLQGSTTSRFDVFLVRNTASVAAKALENESFDFEKSVFQLNKDVQTRNVFVEDIREVFEGIKQKGEMTFPQMVLLLRSCTETAFMCSSSERVLLAEEIWKTAKDFGMEFHISHYNALLNVFVENNHKFSPEEFLNILSREGLEPNEVTYRKLLRAYCLQGNIEGANRILNKIKELKSPLNVDDFNSLILGHCEAGDLEKAADILNVMAEKGIEPSDKSYQYLLCGYAKYGKFEELNKLLDDLPNKDIDVNNSLLLEIVYALAIGPNELKHIDMILNRLDKDAYYSKISNRVIQRLLHKRLDSVALRVFEKAEAEGRATELVVPQSRFILLHFLRYRDPDELFDMCHELTEKGWCRAAESYILKRAFLQNDDRFCLQLLKTMNARKMELRVHYFWPVIIKASKKGNSEVIHVLKSIPRHLLEDCYLTVSRIVCENFKFGEDWRLDFETLRNCGFKVWFLGQCFLAKAIKQKRYEEAEQIVAARPVHNPKAIATIMVHCLQTDPHGERHFVNILYCLAHDDFLYRKRTEQKSETDASGEKSSAYELNNLVYFLKDLSKEELLLRILQGMLEKKMRISSKVASVISSKFKNQEILDVVTKLASPELQFQFDENLLKRKSMSDVSRQSGIAGQKRKELSQVKQNLSSFEDVLTFLRQRQGMKYEDVVAVLEQSTQSLKGQPVTSEVTKEYFGFVCEFIRKDRIDFAEKVFDLGMELGILPEEYTLHYIRKLFQNGKSSLAVDKYCAFSAEKSAAPFALEFLTLAVKSGKDDEATKKLVSFLCEIMPSHVPLTRLALALVDLGQFKKAHKVLEINGLKLTESRFYLDCSLNYSRFKETQTFENYLKFVRKMENFDRVPLYKLLIKKYAENEDVENAKNLWQEIEEDDISDYEFLGKMRDFVSAPTLEGLKNLSGNFLKERKSFWEMGMEGAPNQEVRLDLKYIMKNKNNREMH